MVSDSHDNPNRVRNFLTRSVSLGFSLAARVTEKRRRPASAIVRDWRQVRMTWASWTRSKESNLLV